MLHSPKRVLAMPAGIVHASAGFACVGTARFRCVQRRAVRWPSRAVVRARPAARGAGLARCSLGWRDLHPGHNALRPRAHAHRPEGNSKGDLSRLFRRTRSKVLPCSISQFCAWSEFVYPRFRLSLSSFDPHGAMVSCRVHAAPEMRTPHVSTNPTMAPPGGGLALHRLVRRAR